MFRVGKTLSDTMFLSYMKRYGAEEGENNNEVTLEWLVLKRVYVEFVTGDANNTEANVYYRWISLVTQSALPGLDEDVCNLRGATPSNGSNRPSHSSRYK